MSDHLVDNAGRPERRGERREQEKKRHKILFGLKANSQRVKNLAKGGIDSLM